MKKLASILLTAVFALVFSSGAYAVSVISLFNDGSSTLLSDNSAEFLIDVNQNNLIDVDDILIAMVGLNTIGGTTIGSGTVYNELTAITAIKIATADAIPVAGFNPNSQGITMYSYSAVPLTAADAGYFDWSSGNILGGAYSFTTQAGLTNDGTTIGLIYEDSAQDYTRSLGIQTGLTSTSNGTYRLTIGLDTTTDPDDKLTVVAPNAVSFFSALYLEELEQVQNSSIYLDGTILDQDWPGLDFVEQITGGNGGFAMPELTSEWPIYDNLDFTVRAQVIPEPGTVVLLGFGILGLGWTFRRR